MSGWLRGTVREVHSGDALTIVGAVKAGPPPEKRLTLSSIVAPKLAKRDGTTKDEPYAWQSRELLRKKLIGQPVVFKVDYTVEQLGNREFGSVFLGTTNVAEAIVAAGLAKVRVGGAQQSPYLETLQKAEERAQIAGLGVWTKDPTAQAEAVRDVQPIDAFNATSFLQMTGKGGEVQAVIEAVSNGGMLRATLLPDFQLATVVLCGVQAPSMGRRVAPAAPAPATTDAAGTAADGTAGTAPPTGPPAGPSAAAIAGSSNAEPFALEAKALTEARALNRDVRLIVEGVDKYNNLFATIYVPAVAAAGEAPAATNGAANGSNEPEAAGEESLAELLVKAGFAKCAEWSLGLMTSGSQRLRDLEKAAKQQRVGMWVNYVPPPTNQTKLSDSFTGRVIEVASGDCLVVKDLSSGVERRLQLSSLRAPRMGTRDRGADPYATDAREFLRKRLIGREVAVKMEYNRKVAPAGELVATPGDERVLSFGNVEVVPDKGEERQNVGELVVARGFASVIKHRGEEERSCIYDRLMEVEAMARSAKRGIHSAKEPPANRINDMSQPGHAAKAKQYLPFFQRNGKMQGLIEFVLSGHRMKITIPKEGVTVVFAPSGIKTPARAQPASMGKPAVQGEPYAEEALQFTREHALQRECEVSIDTMDKGGTFLGAITVLPPHSNAKPLNLPVALLRQGLAKLQPSMDPSRLPGGAELAAAQRSAKDARLKIWEKWTPEMDRAEEEEDVQASTAPGAPSAPKEVLQVVVTEVVDAGEFYVQRLDEPRVGWIADQIAAATQGEGPALPPQLKVPSLCLAQYSLDKQWYRAYVERKDPFSDSYHVFFIDYGNREKVSDKCIRTIDSGLAAVPPQALMCSLAYIKVPAVGSEHAGEAKGLLAQLLGGNQPLTATVVAKEKPGPKDDARHPKWQGGGCKRIVTLQETATQADVAVELLCAGLARLPSLRRAPPPVREAVSAYTPYQDEARSARRGMFMYGDPGDSEDEDAPKPSGAWGKPR